MNNKENYEENQNEMYELDNQEVLNLFRSTKEANFVKFLDNYEYINETLVKKGK